MGRQLSGISGNGSTISYKYNESGIRTSKTIDGNETKYIYADDKLTGEVTGNKQIYYRYDSDGNVIALEYNDGTSTNTYSYVKNLQGDIISILDKAGNDVVSYEYNEWGKIVSISGTLAESIGKINPFRYRSYYFDEESGFFYVGSRYYDPNTGRFLNADTSDVIGNHEVLGNNLFTYCMNNPVMYKDNNGMWLERLVCAAAGAVFGPTLLYKMAPQLKTFFSSAERILRKNFSIIKPNRGGNIIGIVLFDAIKIMIHGPHPWPTENFFHLQIEVHVPWTKLPWKKLPIIRLCPR